MSQNPNWKPKRKHNRRLADSGEVLQSLFEGGNSALSEQFIRWKMWRMWEDYAGPTIGKVTEPVGYRRGTLYVWVKNATWMQQLIFMLDPLKTAINKKLGTQYVRAIHLTLDRKAVPSDDPQKEELRTAVERLMHEGDES